MHTAGHRRSCSRLARPARRDVLAAYRFLKEGGLTHDARTLRKLSLEYRALRRRAQWCESDALEAKKLKNNYNRFALESKSVVVLTAGYYVTFFNECDMNTYVTAHALVKQAFERLGYADASAGAQVMLEKRHFSAEKKVKRLRACIKRHRRERSIDEGSSDSPPALGDRTVASVECGRDRKERAGSVRTRLSARNSDSIAEDDTEDDLAGDVVETWIDGYDDDDGDGDWDGSE